MHNGPQSLKKEKNKMPINASKFLLEISYGQPMVVKGGNIVRQDFELLVKRFSFHERCVLLIAYSHYSSLPTLTQIIFDF